MEFFELVRMRESVRKYSPRPIPPEVITKCLEAAKLAPSACNSQPWFFIVVDDKKAKDELADRAFSGIYSINSFAKEAQVLVVVITEKNKYAVRMGGYLRSTQYSLIDVGIACEHFVLQATELGVGTCWLGWFNEKAAKKFLKIPREAKVDIIISMGYPMEENPKEKIRKSLDKIRRFI